MFADHAWTIYRTPAGFSVHLARQTVIYIHFIVSMLFTESAPAHPTPHTLFLQTGRGRRRQLVFLMGLNTLG